MEHYGELDIALLRGSRICHVRKSLETLKMWPISGNQYIFNEVVQGAFLSNVLIMFDETFRSQKLPIALTLEAKTKTTTPTTSLDYIVLYVHTSTMDDNAWKL